MMLALCEKMRKLRKLYIIVDKMLEQGSSARES